VLGEVELLYRTHPNATFVGITGTNGKSTTTALIGHIMEMAGMHPQVGGNLGTPALALTCGDETETPLPPFILEMSSYQLDLTHSVRFHAAILLNLSPDHLERHGDMEGYMEAKRRIFAHQTREDVAIIGIDDAYCESLARQCVAAGKQTVIPITLRDKSAQGIEVKNALLQDRRDGTKIDLSACKGLRGAHNWQNAAAAYAACRHLGVAPEVIAAGCASFPGLAHRMEWVLESGGVVCINDSKATNADSTANALAAYENIYWIAGGRPKSGGIASLARFFPRIRHAYLLGEAEAEFAATLEGHVPYTRCGTLKQATACALEAARAAGGGVVLLSPACASWDQWPNFEVRGDAFKEYARKLFS
jgi:UDP-N-acetylmuramoylalanine--D-glutamate ligase